MIYFKPKTLVRAWDVDVLNYPQLTQADWQRRCHADMHGVQQVFEDENRILDKGMETIAAIIARQQAPWQNGGWYQQALGHSAVATAAGNPGLIKERIRKPFTETFLDGRIIMTNTFFTGADFASVQTTVASVTSASVVTLVTSAGLELGDLLRVFLATGYEFKTISGLAGNVVTFDSALSAVPAIGATVDQVVEEAGLMGNVPAGYTTGTVAVTNGNAIVTGTGTAWVDKVAPGDRILVGAQSATNRTYHTIASVDSNTQLTLTAPYTGATAAGQVYQFHGTPFNRVASLRYIKLASRGFVLENQWNTGG